jgi:hypothetical protein
MTPAEFRDIALSFPGVEEGASYGEPAFLVRGKFLTRLRRDDGGAVLMDVPLDEREMLMEAEPDTFYFTAHYKDYPAVLARLATLHAGSARNFIERRWRRLAKKADVKAWEAAKADG